ncbi:hypothetical protein M9H77_09018 [Catharanthus roseus]|uniref:Uncharacterized protein n=1 Tax=Catharanthus roseus TaxID=4058 RepID=A0ACC0BZD6_CATRO|nr:hypothetical protein M9H77_09018 [Catharanthus roseus]
MRYLIVLDDIWSTEILNDFKPIFLDDNNGSRIILTTRLMDVAGIAKKCQGLPLPIAVVAGHLSKVPLSQNCWADVANRILNIESQSFSEFPEEIMDLDDMRYLELSACGNIPGSVSNLCKLETLINNHKSTDALVLPKEIWLLRYLQHFELGTCIFLAPVTVKGSSCVSTLVDLQMLSSVSLESCSELALSGIPNVKRLKICGIRVFGAVDSRGKLFAMEKNEQTSTNPYMYRFPQSLKKLTLRGSYLSWEYMDILALLPNLVQSRPPRDSLDSNICYLKLWIADIIHFPILHRLVLRSCHSLEVIPCCIGDIPTLDSIKLIECSESANESARIIQKEQRSMSNYSLQVLIRQKKIFKPLFGLSILVRKRKVKSLFGV